MTVQYRVAAAGDLAPTDLYAILRLRIDVFVVEQRAAYADIDGRDIEPGAELVWAHEDGVVLSTARVLLEPGGMRIGRVATAETARSRGVASEIMRRSIDRCRERDAGAAIELDAQKQLVDWYGRFGFAVCGDEYLEDGIPHLPMRLLPLQPTTTDGVDPSADRVPHGATG